MLHAARTASSLRYGGRNGPLTWRRYCVASTRTYGIGNRSATTPRLTLRGAYRSNLPEVNHVTRRTLHARCCLDRADARGLPGRRASVEPGRCDVRPDDVAHDGGVVSAPREAHRRAPGDRPRYQHRACRPLHLARYDRAREPQTARVHAWRQ